MTVLLYLIPLALALGLTGLAAWSRATAKGGPEP